MDEYQRELELAAEIDEEALLKLTQFRLRNGQPPTLPGITLQLLIIEEELERLQETTKQQLLPILAETFSKFHHKYPGVVDSISWECEARHSDVITRERITGYRTTGPYLEIGAEFISALRHNSYFHQTLLGQIRIYLFL